MSDEKASRLNWTPDEWLRVAVNMLPMLEQGVTRLVALARSMRKVLGKPRHHDDKWIHKASAPAAKYLNRYLDEARKLSPEQRDALTQLTPAQAYAKANPDAPKPPKAPKPEKVRKLAKPGTDIGRDYKSGSRWTTLDKAKLARMILWFRAHGVESALSRLFIEAQELVLPAERRHGIKSIQAGVKVLPAYLAEGEANLWLLENVPFDPPHPPGEETAGEGAETAQTEAIAADPVQTPPEPVPAALAPLAAMNMSAAAQAFGATMMQALDTLLGHHTQCVLASIETRLSEASARMAAEAASMIQSGMRKAVADMLSHELGGPVAPAVTAPAPPAPLPSAKTPPPAPNHHHNPVPPSSERPEQLKVDVVGFEDGAQEKLVHSAFSGEVDLRFIHPDKMSTFAPHRNRHVVMMIGRVPHALAYKFKAAKVEPIITRRTPGHVIHAIEELQRSQSAAVAH